MSHNEEEAVQNPSIRTAVRMIAAEVEKTEGRGQLRVRDDNYLTLGN